MIVKELDDLIYEDKYSQSGYDAEKQMAYYLKHKFYTNKNIFVINNLRFPWLDEYTQIDHCLIHEYGVIIIESKSVSSKVRYNALGEWHRLWDNSWKGISNPVKQAERQSEAIKGLLNNNCEKLRGKLLGIQKRFGLIQVDCLVAISDHCNKIERPEPDAYENIVIKADLITDRICQILEDYKKRNRIFSKENPPWTMSLEEATRVKDFLLEQHEPKVKTDNKKTAIQQPVEKSAVEYSNKKTEETIVRESPKKYYSDPASQEAYAPKSSENSAETEEKIHSLANCPKCKGDVTILWGDKHKNYYWHCRSCGENIGINYKCPGCKQKLRIRKQLKEYFIYCEPCKLEALYNTEKQ